MLSEAQSLEVEVDFMVKVKITRDCSIEGKHYEAGDTAEAIEKYRDSLFSIRKSNGL